MISILAKIFIKDHKNLKDPKVRRDYGMLTAGVGIVLNTFVFAIKAFAGFISGSVAVVADGFNNLSDALSSFLSMLGYACSAKEPDADHPFGHGRIEYIMGLIVSMMIIVVGCELFTSSVGKLVRSDEINPSINSVIILIVSILIKFYMYLYNKRIAKMIDSAAMAATAADSISDVLSTSVVLLSTCIFLLTGKNVDGICGMLVALFIIYQGIMSAKETVSPLLGQPPSEEFVESVYRIIGEYPEVLGTHDLLVHDYGPGRIMLSIHAEVSGDENIYKIHDMIDHIERELKRKLGCEAVIHMDPVNPKDVKLAEMSERVLLLVKSIDERLTIHDFRLVDDESSTKMVFDVLVPKEFKGSLSETEERIKKDAEAMGNYEAVVKMDWEM